MLTSILNLLLLILTVASFVSGDFYTERDGIINLTPKNADAITTAPAVTIIEFYAPWCGHCKSLVPAYKAAAKKLAGLATVAAINCDEEENKPICGRFGIKGFPSIKVIKSIFPKSKPGTFSKATVDYQNQRTAAGMVDFVIGQLPSTLVTQLPNEAFLSGSTLRIVLFNKKGSTPSLWKALSVEYFKRVEFGEVKKDEALIKDFGVKSFPAVVLIKKDGEKVIYDGVMKHDGIAEFIDKYAPPSTKKASPASPPKSPSPPPPAPAPAPAPYNATIPQIKTAEEFKTLCVDSPHFCVLTFVAHEPEFPESTAALNKTKELLQALKKKTHDVAAGSFAFFYVNTVSTPYDKAYNKAVLSFLRLFEVSDMVPSLLLLRPKKGLYVNYRGAVDETALMEWVGSVRSGRAKAHRAPEGWESGLDGLSPAAPVAAAAEKDKGQCGTTKESCAAKAKGDAAKDEL